MPDIMAGHGHEWAKTVANDAKIGVPPTFFPAATLNGGASRPGFTRRGGRLASGRPGLARCRAMMPKRVVAGVLVAVLVLAGAGVLGSLFF
ncbi:hypothetical protein [Amycolatopsis sp. NPDC021455]|uniref:hypothetical protein n=1 Tax=Amycolatopsis sp. NPDC021455 TaxID=3154901 RepID=UPI0033F3F736